MTKAERVLSAIMHMTPAEEIEKIQAEDEEKLKTETEGESKEEGECENEDRWNCARPGREADCVNKIKEIVAFLYAQQKDELNKSIQMYDGWCIVASCFDDPSIKNLERKIAIAFMGWLMLSEHKLDGMGGHWSSGCFGSFWADIALTIPQMHSIYCGFRVDFNLKPCASRPAWFLIDHMETLDEKLPLFRRTSAMFAEFGVRKDWGTMLYNHLGRLEAEQEKEAKAEKAKRDAEKAEKAAEKAEKLAKKAEKMQEEEMERRARDAAFAAKLAEERRAQEEEIRVAREAEFAQRVAALAEREKAAKEQERLAKLEQARISEENRKLKAQQKEAERLAKFVNKKK